MQQGFVDQVVADVPKVIEQKVVEMIDWLVNADLKQWQGVMDYMDRRKKEYEDRIVGEVGGSFRYDRDHFIDSVGRSARQVVDGYDTTDEAMKIAESAQMAVASTAAVEIGAIGLGAIVTALATTAALDVTGILAASVVAALGLFIIPARRQSAKKEMVSRVAALRTQLTTALTVQFQKELNQSLQRINDSVAPYTRFVRVERETLQQTQAELNQARKHQARLRAEIEAIVD
jgi:hypothetical protein